MVSLRTMVYATGQSLPMSPDRAVAVLAVGIVVFVAICYLWYRDYRRMQGGDTA